jgi:ABC-type multidrug transport system fused ATPase/permease subunit
VTVEGGTAALPARGALSACDTTFAYDGDVPAAADISLTVGAGEHLALVGATGAGKSTLAKLLVRFYDPQQGAVTFGDVDLRTVGHNELRRRTCSCQEGHLFGSIADNVRLAAGRR